MITKKMQTYLINHVAEPLGDIKSKIKHCVYMNRMQKRIDRELKFGVWLAKHHPKIFLDEEKEWKDESGKIVSHRRLKALLIMIKLLNPNMEVELVLKNLNLPDEEDKPKT